MEPNKQLRDTRESFPQVSSLTFKSEKGSWTGQVLSQYSHSGFSV